MSFYLLWLSPSCLPMHLASDWFRNWHVTQSWPMKMESTLGLVSGLWEGVHKEVQTLCFLWSARPLFRQVAFQPEMKLTLKGQKRKPVSFMELLIPLCLWPVYLQNSSAHTISHLSHVWIMYLLLAGAHIPNHSRGVCKCKTFMPQRLLQKEKQRFREMICPRSHPVWGTQTTASL